MLAGPEFKYGRSGLICLYSVVIGFAFRFFRFCFAQHVHYYFPNIQRLLGGLERLSEALPEGPERDAWKETELEKLKTAAKVAVL